MTENQKKQLDEDMAHFAQITSQALGTDYCNTPGAGAAGGLGFAFLSYLGATLTPGIELILNAVGLKQELSDADVVVTGEGRLDFQTAMGKALWRGELAKKHHAKVIAFAGSVTKEAAACNKEGIDAFFPNFTKCLHTCGGYGSCHCKKQYDSHCRAGLPAALSDIMV